MRTIRLLSALVANQIAAGEVIERPASIVKELIENSLDAGSSHIDIEIEKGGIQLIRIRDNGHGIKKEELHLAFTRHATSKIETLEDLNKTFSLGFRGEALASIASIANCRLMSLPDNQESAWLFTIAPHQESTYEPIAHLKGTTVEITNLFYLTPVRRKFLKSEKTEFQVIEEVVKRLALSANHVTFRLLSQGKEIRHYPKVNSPLHISSRLAKICGASFVEKAHHVSANTLGLSLQGWIANASLDKRHNDCQYFFINGRFVKDKILNHVIKTWHDAQLDAKLGTYPAYVLYLAIEPQVIDVNVHPTKHEVRFLQPRLVHDFMRHALDKIEKIPVALLTQNETRSKEDFIVKEPKSIPSLILSQQYFVHEVNENILFIDVIKAKQQLFACYFQTYRESIPTLSLLFPVTLPKMLEKYETYLNSMGFICQAQDAKKVIVQQPQFLKGLELSTWLNSLDLQLEVSFCVFTHYLAEQLAYHYWWGLPCPVQHELAKICYNTNDLAGFFKFSQQAFKQHLVALS